MSRYATLLLSFFLALPLAAQQRISRIEVRGDVPASIVIAQSALAEGNVYSADDLDAAVSRVRRLPFVFDARYVVEGETLRIDVTGMTRLFGEVDSSAAKTRFNDASATFLGVGARHFLGAGVAQAQVNFLGEGEGSLRGELQFSHYRIAGTRLFAIVNATMDLNSSGLFEHDPSFALTAGYPITIRQTITASAFRTGYTASRDFPGLPRALRSESETTGIELLWTYDTSEDPFFARRGTTISAGPSWTEFETLFEGATIPLPPAQPSIRTTRNDGETSTAAFEARRFWPIRSRSTFIGAIEGSLTENEFERRTNDDPSVFGNTDEDAVRISAGLAHNFFDWSSPVTDGRHRVELMLAASRRDETFGSETDTEDERSVSIGYAYRKRFATVRVNLLWAFD